MKRGESDYNLIKRVMEYEMHINCDESGQGNAKRIIMPYHRDQTVT